MERPVLAELEAGPSLDTGEAPRLRRELGRLDAICLLVTAIVALALSVFAAPLVAGAQPQGKIPDSPGFSGKILDR